VLDREFSYLELMEMLVFEGINFVIRLKEGPKFTDQQGNLVACQERTYPAWYSSNPFLINVADYHLVIWIFQRDNLSGFGRAEAGWWDSTQTADFDGLDKSIGMFHCEADIPILWQQVEPDCRSADRMAPAENWTSELALLVKCQLVRE